MSNIGRRPASEACVDAMSNHNLSHRNPAGTGNASSQAMPARLQVIHDLIRAGGYHVPATAIAERMIEQMIVEKQERKS